MRTTNHAAFRVGLWIDHAIFSKTEFDLRAMGIVYGLIFFAGFLTLQHALRYLPLALSVTAQITWIIVFCNVLAPQVLWSKWMRRHQPSLLIVSGIVLVGMWLERYMIITTSLHRDYLPSSWGMFYPTIWDYLTYFSSIGLFLVMFLLFVRVAPLISMSELRGMIPGTKAHGEGR